MSQGIRYSMRMVGRTFSKFPKMADKEYQYTAFLEIRHENVHLTVDVPPRDDFLDLIHAKTSFMLAPLTSDCVAQTKRTDEYRYIRTVSDSHTFLAKVKSTP